MLKIWGTCKSFSEALILPSVNPEYDTRLFIEFPLEIQVQKKIVYKKCFLFLFWHSKQDLYTTCSELVYFGGFNEQSLVILWVNWFKNKVVWKRFTCVSSKKLKIPPKWLWAKNSSQAKNLKCTLLPGTTYLIKSIQDLSFRLRIKT